MVESLRVRWGEGGNEEVPKWVDGRCLVVGAGPTGQLAAELLASSLQLPVAARLQHPALPPLAGAGAGPARLMAAASQPVATLVLRSQPAGRLAGEFTDRLAGVLEKCKPSLVFILASADGSENSRITSGPYRYLANKFVDDLDNLRNLGWNDYEVEKPNSIIFGAKFAHTLYKNCTDRNVPCVLLFRYCYGGDMSLAKDLLQNANTWIKAIKHDKSEFEEQLIYPLSWEFFRGKPIPDIF